LDAAEEGGIAPVITIMIDARTILVADNGPGMSPDLVEAPLRPIRAHQHARGLRGKRLV
jgi:DNA topoisomerase VI subunit B